MRLTVPTVAFMQRQNGRFTRGYTVRRAALRGRKEISPQPPGPATTPRPNVYALRVRNTPDPPNRRAVWATYVRKLREATHISRPELARRLGVDPATVWRWETEKQKPESPDIPEAIARLFALDINEVMAAAGLRPMSSDDHVAIEPYDEEIELVRTDPNLDEDMKARIVAIILERRVRDRAASLAETHRLIDLMRRRPSGPGSTRHRPTRGREAKDEDQEAEDDPPGDG